MSRNHVFVCGPKYTIFHRLVQGIVRSLIIHLNFQIGDTSLRCGEMGKSQKITKFGTNFYPTCRFIWGSPQNFKTSFGYSFSGPIARKSLNHAPTLRGEKNFALPQFFVPQILDPISIIASISDLLNYKGFLLVKWPRTLGSNKKFWGLSPNKFAGRGSKLVPNFVIFRLFHPFPTTEWMWKWIIELRTLPILMVKMVYLWSTNKYVIAAHLHPPCGQMYSDSTKQHRVNLLVIPLPNVVWAVVFYFSTEVSFFFLFSSPNLRGHSTDGQPL